MLTSSGRAGRWGRTGCGEGALLCDFDMEIVELIWGHSVLPENKLEQLECKLNCQFGLSSR